ncbi:MAG: ScyD/ScyE family protein [Verrucomicrobiae bacterium]|nr:ScyD/ScyE family protein [Verrucomicrobiae bacterium]
MKTRSILCRPTARAIMLTLSVLGLSLATHLPAQTPCPELQVLATGLLGPSKIIQTPLGNYLVAEVGTEELNSSRVSIVDRNGQRRTLLEGLPSAPAFVGDPSGASGLYLQARTLYIVNGQGDVTLAGPVQGTEKSNPAPASPIFSSVVAMDFPESLETNTVGFAIALADHQALKSGAALTVTNAGGESTTLRLIVDFADYLPDPRPTFADNVRHSHPYGIVADSTHLYVVDAGFNNVRKVESATGTEQTLTSFPPTPSPLTNGPPVIENVPTSIHWVGGQLVVTLLGGAPFLPGLSKVVQVDPQTGAVTSLISGLTTAVDTAPLLAYTLNGGVLTLEYALTFPQPGPGRLQSFAIPTTESATNSACLTTPSSMLIDRRSRRLILSELSTDRLVWLPVPPSPSRTGYIYFSEFAGGRLNRANLDGSGKVTLVSGLSNPIGPALDLDRGRMYWGEASIATMRRANLDGTGQTTVVSNPSGGIPAFDFAGDRMYWAVSSRGNIWSANLDGSDQLLLISGQNDPHALVLDVAAGKMYWPEFGAGNIRRANLDGGGITILVSGQAGPSLMDLDIAGGKMYWANQWSGDIRRANLDGTGQEILVQNQNSPAGIALDLARGRMYWTTIGSGDIRRANLDGTGQQIIIQGLSGPAFITVDLSSIRTPNIRMATYSGSDFTLEWSAMLGRGYQVQFKSALAQSNWTNLGSRRTATNTTMSVTDPGAIDPQRFYRVLLFP